jgi:RNA polymerase I-specific transcription initiation factor RRN6
MPNTRLTKGRMEALSSHINVLDVDDASAKLNELSVGGNKRNDVEFRRIASATALHWIDKEEPTISSLYDAILHYWIAPLPLEVPVRIRQHKERLARRIAAEVMLASSRISYTDDTPYLQSIPKQDHSIVLPVLPSASQEKTGLSSISQWSSQSLAMPSSSAIPSSQPPSSPLLSEFFPSTAASDPLARLRKHLSVNEDVINTAIPQSVTQLLSHWQLGADPHDYDWDATERTLRLPDDTDETSQAQREKERRKKERREKRQKREDELMRAKTATQPSYPRSSPGPMFGDVPSSSQVASQAPSQVLHSGHVFGGHGGFGPTMPLSQVEPGRYGGRPDKKKKKGRGRISGF